MKILKKININARQPVPMSSLFPLAKLHGPISPELVELWERQNNAHERQRDFQAPFYEKVLFHGFSIYQYINFYDIKCDVKIAAEAISC